MYPKKHMATLPLPIKMKIKYAYVKNTIHYKISDCGALRTENKLTNKDENKICICVY